MKLSSLINKEDNIMGKDVEILGLSHNSKFVGPGYAFFAISGQQKDGYYYIDEAIRNGASAIITDKELPNCPASVVKTPNARKAMAKYASRFYGEPQNKMKFVLITGTNGKTTTTYMLQKIFNDNGINCGIIGTNGAIFGEKTIETGMTTPDPIELYKILDQMQNSGVRVVIMEASAHALYYDKLDGIISDVSVLTNITQDHLDFFENMENYANAKYKLFKKENSKFAVICCEDEFSKALFQDIEIPAISCGKDEFSNIKLINVEQNNIGQNFKILSGEKLENYAIKLNGLFNVKNAMCAIAVAKLFNLNYNQIKQSLEGLEPVPGRFNKIMVDNKTVIIDYAHTPDGVLNVLNAGKELTNGNKLIVVFGCGGLRDAAKRPLMGNIACKNADYVYITSDNPRTENPKTIINNIIFGTHGYKNYEAIEDRKTAIKTAIENSKAGDVIMILGKGCENYMEINGTKYPYSDYDVVYNLVNKGKEK